GEEGVAGSRRGGGPLGERKCHCGGGKNFEARLVAGILGKPGRAGGGQSAGVAAGTSRCTAKVGKALERLKTRRGSADGAILNLSAAGTDSRGDENREVGQRHLPHT